MKSCAEGATSFGADVAAEVHERGDRLGDERRRVLRVGEGVRPRACGSRRGHAGRVHLGLDDAGVAVVDGPHDGDRAAVLARVTQEELARLAHGIAAAAFTTAWATVSRSAKPSKRATRSPGRR